jgi:hypothetical protein
MPDQRTPLQRRIDETIGPPLYYCAECLRAVKVQSVEGGEPEITRPCGPECGEAIIAPRKAIVAGVGGLSMSNKVKLAAMQVAASLTGRCV